MPLVPLALMRAAEGIGRGGGGGRMLGSEPTIGSSGAGPSGQAVPPTQLPDAPAAPVLVASEMELSEMNKKQRWARAGNVARREPDRFFADANFTFRLVSPVLMADGAAAQSNAHATVFSDEDIEGLERDVANAWEGFDEEVACGELREDSPLPLECRQVPVPRIRGYCEFHIAYHLKKERASLFLDNNNVDLLRADLGRLSKELGWPWMKAPAMRALMGKWRHEPQAVAFLEQYIDRPFTYAEMNARTSGGIPNTNVAQEAANRCAL
jgi:hypothetical protein